MNLTDTLETASDIKSGGKIEASSDIKSGGNIQAASDMKAGGDVASSSASLNSHTHLYNPGPGSPTPTQTGTGGSASGAASASTSSTPDPWGGTDAEQAFWTNIIPHHEPWARTFIKEYETNVDHEPEYPYEDPNVGKSMKKVKETDRKRGKVWHR